MRSRILNVNKQLTISRLFTVVEDSCLLPCTLKLCEYSVLTIKMEQLPGSSTSIENLKDGREQLLKSEDFKSELTNALKYCVTLLEAKDLLTNTPPDQISSVSIVMGEVIYEEIINILGDRQIITEDDLILFDESDMKDYTKVC